MKLILENLSDPAAFHVVMGDSTVDISHFSVFDPNTGETDSLSLTVLREDNDRGLRELKTTGSCTISGKHGDLELAVKQGGTLSVSMIGKQKTIHLQRLSFRVEDQDP